MIKHLLPCAWLLWVLCMSTPAMSHGLDPGQALLHLVGDTVHLKVLPPAQAFPWCEATQGPARLSAAQVHACRQALLGHATEVFEVLNERGEAGTPIFEDVNLAQGHHAAQGQAPQALRFTLRYRWEAPPKGLQLRYTRADLGPLRVLATRLSTARALPQRAALEPSQSLLLTAQHPAHHLWQAPASPQPDPPPPASPGLPDTALLLGALALLGSLWRQQRPHHTQTTERSL